jgi:translation initiation factor eIF-2B subunit alpha
MTSSNQEQNFDVVDAYKRLLADDAELTMPVAAIEALVLALAHTPATTVSETMELLKILTLTLKARIPNPISLSAGTDLFQRYITTTLQKSAANGDANFDAIRSHLVQNGRLFVERAKEARDKIAGFGRHFVRDGSTVLTNGGSRVVGALLRSAAETSAGFGAQGSIRFRVIYVVSDSSDAESSDNINQLRKLGIPVATIPPTAIAYCLNQVSQCFVGAEGVVENGGIISRLGTYQIAMLAKAANKPFYVVSETHKFVRLYPLGQTDLGISQKIVEFKTIENGLVVIGDDSTKEDGVFFDGGSNVTKDEGVADMDVDSNVSPYAKSGPVANTDAVDFTVSNMSMCL